VEKPSNPYAPPATDVAPRVSLRGDRSVSGQRFAGTAFKWVYVLTGSVAYASFGLTLATSSRRSHMTLMLLRLIFNVVEACAAGGWFYAAWSARPFPRAHAHVSSWGAVGRMLIPLYGILFWMFVATRELAESLHQSTSVDDGLVEKLAKTACALQALAQLGTFLFWVTHRTSVFVIPLGMTRMTAWAAFMFSWERRRAL
jgi:hypothetical protein